MSQTIFYLVGPDAPALAVINDCEAQRTIQRRAIDQLQEKYGASEVWLGQHFHHLAGFSFKGNAPEGFRLSGEFFVPNLRSKKGKAIAEEIAAIPKWPDALTFSERLGQETGQSYVFYGSPSFLWAQYAIYGDKVILAVPADLKVVPEGCTELKYSEYVAIYEAAKAAELAKKEASHV